MGKKKSQVVESTCFYLLLSQTHLVHKFIILQPKPASGFTSLFLLKILFKLKAQCHHWQLLPAPRPRKHMCMHTHTHTSYNQSGSPIWASCTSSLILSVSCPPVDLQYCCHCNSGPQHLSEPPLHKIRSKVLWAQLSHFHRSGLGTVPLGIGCMDSRDNSQKQSLVEASAES